MSKKRKEKEKKKINEETKEECHKIPECNVCHCSIDINNHLGCRVCQAVWCTDCIQNWFRKSKKCTMCEGKLDFDNLKPRYGIIELDKEGKPNAKAIGSTPVVKDNISELVPDSNYESTLLLFYSYIENAKKADKRYDAIIEKLESLNEQRELKINEYIEELKLSKLEADQLALETENLLDLDLYLMKQKIEAEPYSCTECLVSFKLDNSQNDAQTSKIISHGDIYEIKFEEKSEPKALDVKLSWIDPPKIWDHDVKVNIYYKDEQDKFIPLNEFPILFSRNENGRNTENLCTINEEILLSSRKVECDQKVVDKLCENKVYSKIFKTSDNAQTVPTVSYSFEFKFVIGKIDYSYHKLKHSMFFKSIKSDMVKTIHQQ